MDRQKIERKTYAWLGKTEEFLRRFRAAGKLQTVTDSLFFFAITAILCRGKILNAYAPFGISFAAAASYMGNSFASAVGAFFGYILLGTGTSGLSNGGAVLITVAIGHIFAEQIPNRSRLFLPLIGAASGMLTGVPFLDWTKSSEILSFLCCGAVTFGAAYFYILGLEKNLEEKSLKVSGLLVLVATLLISAYSVTWFGMLHPSRVIALLFVMAVAYIAGHTGGAAAGVAMGITMDAAQGNGMFFTCIYGFSALIAGIFHRTNRIVFSCSFLIACTSASLLGIENTNYFSVLSECLTAAVIFLLLPEGIWLWVREYLGNSHPRTGEYVRKVRKTAKNYVLEASRAFYEMYLAVMDSVQKKRGVPEDCLGDIYRRTADKVCKHCEIGHICWERDYVSTLNALNDASSGLLKNGMFRPQDFPSHFVARCIHFTDFISFANESYRALRQRQQYLERIRENKGLVAEQYAGLTGILRQIGNFMGAGPEFLPNWEEMLRKYASAFGTVEHTAAYRDPFGRICLEVSGDFEDQISEDAEGFASGLSALTGVALSPPQKVSDEMGSRFLLKEKEPLKAEFVQLEKSKDEVSVNGDCCTSFISDDGKAYLLLADGMGTGKEAQRDSSVAIRMLERFLKTGICLADALKTISPAIRIRNEEEGFLALDAVGVDLYTGQCELLKCSSAAVYICQGGEVRRITGKGLPFGLLYGEGEQELLTFVLKAKDQIILVTDGICDALCDDWLKHMLEDKKHKNSKKLAQAILTEAEKHNPVRDDKTICIMELMENK